MQNINLKTLLYCDFSIKKSVVNKSCQLHAAHAFFHTRHAIFALQTA